MVSNKEISILIFNNQEISSKTLLILEDWSRKGFLKNFLAIGNYQKDIESLTCVEYINGNINAIDDVQYRLSQEEYELIRIVTITEPKDPPTDIRSIEDFLNVPRNIELKFLNIIFPRTDWIKQKDINSGTLYADVNILISPVDRANPRRVPIDIKEDNFYLHIASNAVACSSLWRGMEKGPFDEEKRNFSGNLDFLVARNFTRLLIGPDPVIGILDTLTNDNGKWITPHQSYKRPNDDYFMVTKFSNLVIDKYSDIFNYEKLDENKKTKNIGIIDYIKNLYSNITSNDPLPWLSDAIDAGEKLRDFFEDEKNEIYQISKTTELENINQINDVLIKKYSSRGETSVPSLWREIRQIVFSFIDGSPLPADYTEHKERIVLNNPKFIVSDSGINLDGLGSGELNNEDEIMDPLEENNSSEDPYRTFFGNFISQIYQQINSVLPDLQTVFSEIIKFNDEDPEVIEENKKNRKRLKIINTILSVFLLNVILFFTNYLLVTGGYVEVIFNIALLDNLTPSGVLNLSILLIIAWFYMIYKGYKTYLQLKEPDEGLIRELEHCAKHLVEFENLIKQFELWSMIYGNLIHSSLTYEEDELDLSRNYVEFAPLTSLKGNIGKLNNEVIKDIQNQTIKEGWFRDIYVDMEDVFKDYLTTKVQRYGENLMDLVDTEDTNKDDGDSPRKYFFDFLKEGKGKEVFRNHFQENIETVIEKTESSELFDNRLQDSQLLDEFLGETVETDDSVEKEFDRRIWSTVARVFHVQKVEGVSREDIDSTKYTIDSGKPIQRIVVRTDKSERIDEGQIIDKDWEPPTEPETDPDPEDPTKF